MERAGQSEIGDVRDEELEELLRLMCEAFALPFDAARDIFYSDPYFDIHNKRVLRVGGRIVSCLTIVERACWLGTGVAKLAGIAGVATLATERRRGYAGRLLSETTQELDARGYALAALVPFSYGYYRAFGWELAGYRYRGLIAPSQLPAYPEARYVRVVRPEDAPYLERIYTTRYQGQSLRCLRDAKRWTYILEHVKQRVVYAPDNTTVQGYLLYEHHPGSGEPIAPGVTLPPTLRVLEMGAATPAARRGLLGHLAAQTNVGSIEYDATLGDLTTGGLLEPRGASFAGGEILASVETLPYLMTRIVNFRRVLEALCADWADLQGTVAFVLRDSGQEKGLLTLIVEGTGGIPSVRESLSSSERSSVPDRLDGDTRVWAQVVVGHRSGEDACALGLLEASTPRARELAARLFPRREPFLLAVDSF